MADKNSDNFANDSKKATNAAKSAGRAGKNATKKTAKKIKSKISKKPKKSFHSLLPLKIKIAVYAIIGLILGVSILVGGTGGIYSNENTHIYANQFDKNFPMLKQMSAKDKKKDTYKKDDAIAAMSKYSDIVHEFVEEDRENVEKVIDSEIAAKNWDPEETKNQLDDRTSLDNEETTFSFSSDEKDDNPESTSSGKAIVEIAREYIGPTYTLGGNKIGKHGKNSTDCSGFTMLLYKKYAKVKLPRTVSEQEKCGKTVGYGNKALKKAQLGDLLIYHGSDHVGIFSGKTKKGKYKQVHCSVGWGKRGVMETALHRDVYKIVRVLDGASNIEIPKGSKKGSVSTKTVEGKCWVAFKNCGYSDEAAAGAMGNIQQECNFNVAYDSGGDVGLFNMNQGRGASMQKYASSKGKNWKKDPAIQIEWLDKKDASTQFNTFTGKSSLHDYGNGTKTWWQQKISYKKYKKIDQSNWKRYKQNPDGQGKDKNAVQFCAHLFNNVFERAGIPRMDNRRKYAENWYKKFAGKILANDSGEEDTGVTLEDLKILAAYSVSIGNLQARLMSGEYQIRPSSVGHKMLENKNYYYVDEKGNHLDIAYSKSTGQIDFEKDIKDKLENYVDECDGQAFFKVTFQKDSTGGTTHKKTITVDTDVLEDGEESKTAITKVIKYGVPIVEEKDISKICLPMFGLEPDDTYVNSSSTKNADAIMTMVKNTIAVYFDGDPSLADGENETIAGELQNKYAWPAPGHEKKKDYKLKGKTLYFKGEKGDPVAAIAKGKIISVKNDKSITNKNKKSFIGLTDKTKTPKDNGITDITKKIAAENIKSVQIPKTVVVKHEKGALKAIYSGVILNESIKKGSKLSKGQIFGSFAFKKMSFQIEYNGKKVNPLQFLKSFGTGNLIWPAKKGWTFGRGWGVWSTLGDQSAHIHQGIDITAPGGIGAPVLAMDNGIVVTPVKWVSCRGWYLVIKHNNKLYSLYQHLSSTSKGMVKRGQIVKKGQKIAEQGGSFKTKGNDCSTHIHFEVYPKYPVRGGRIPWETANRGETYDPLKFLPKSKKVPSSYSKNIGKIKKFEHH